MNTKKLVLLFVISLLLFGNTAAVSAAPSVITKEKTDWPKCGDYEIQAYSDYSDSNISIQANWQQIFIFNLDNFKNAEGIFLNNIVQGLSVSTFNGWKITAIEILDSNIMFTYPGGTTQAVENPELQGIPGLLISLSKDCDSEARFTGRYVYTLLGSFPCNLVGFEKSIPARFLNPEYVADLCDIPGLAHDWNGDWVKHQEMDHGGYFTGGPHYDTSLTTLP